MKSLNLGLPMLHQKSAYFPQFYTSEKSLSRYFKERGRANGHHATSKKDTLVWQKKSRKRLSQIFGLHLFKSVPLQAKRLSVTQIEDLVREEWLVLTESEVWMPVTLLLPAKIAKPTGAVICFHGHGMAGRFGPSGRFDIQGMKEVYQNYNCDYGYQLAKRGLIAVCPDARGFGQRRQGSVQEDVRFPERFYQSSCRFIQLASVPLGLNLQGMFAWDASRLVDWLVEDKRVDKTLLGAVGLSGGGMQTLNLAALDERIKVAVVSGYFYGVKEALLEMNENCLCNMVPQLWENFDMGDLGALCAPRNLLIESGTQDHLNGKSGIKNVTSQFAITQKAFKNLGQPEKTYHHVFQGGHTWDGDKSIPWVLNRLSKGTEHG